jgi:hypothetical protein
LRENLTTKGEDIPEELPKTDTRENTTFRGSAPPRGARDGHTQQLLPSNDGNTQEIPVEVPKGERRIDLGQYVEEFKRAVRERDSKRGEEEPPQSGPEKTS